MLQWRRKLLVITIDAKYFLLNFSSSFFCILNFWVKNKKKQTFFCFRIQLNKIIIFSGQSYDRTFAILKTLFFPFCFFLMLWIFFFCNDICPLCCFCFVDPIQSVVVPFKFNCFIMPFNYEIHFLFAVFESIAMCTMEMKCFRSLQLNIFAYMRNYILFICTLDGTKMVLSTVACRHSTNIWWLSFEWYGCDGMMEYHLLYGILNFQWKLIHLKRDK